jgi:hypothetical protein
LLLLKVKIIWDQNIEGGAAAFPSIEETIDRPIETEEVIEEAIAEPEPVKPTLRGFGLGHR